MPDEPSLDAERDPKAGPPLWHCVDVAGRLNDRRRPRGSPGRVTVVNEVTWARARPRNIEVNTCACLTFIGTGS